MIWTSQCAPLFLLRFQIHPSPGLVLSEVSLNERPHIISVAVSGPGAISAAAGVGCCAARYCIAADTASDLLTAASSAVAAGFAIAAAAFLAA